MDKIYKIEQKIKIPEAAELSKLEIPNLTININYLVHPNN